MNIVQLHDRIRFWTDTVGSARFDAADIDQAANNSIKEVVDEKYDRSKLNHSGDSFQRTQRIRDELSNITKELDTDGSLTLTNQTGYVMLTTFPSDYRYLLAIALFVGTTRYNAWPLTYDRQNTIDSNPYRRTRSGLFPKLYYIESDQGIKVLHPFASTAPTKVLIAYLADPVDVDYGTELGPSDIVGLSTSVIASKTTTLYDGTEYKSGDEFTTNGVTDTIDYGLVVKDFVNPDINGFLHEEVAKRAAANCLLTAGDFEKYKAFKAEVLAV
jgi:hypothetical protein